VRYYNLQLETDQFYDHKKGVTLWFFIQAFQVNIVVGVESDIMHLDHTTETVSVVQSASRHTTEHTKTTLLT